MKPEFHKTVNVLVQAYLNDTLEHSTCAACAVGNIIIAAGCPLPSERDEYVFWLRYIDATHRRGPWEVSEHELEVGKKQIDATGYSSYELHRIEKAFESCPHSDDEDEWNYNGLMAVLDVLADIHNVDLSVREDAKLLFQ